MRRSTGGNHRDNHALVTGKPDASKGARPVWAGGHWKRTINIGHLASGLPVLVHSRSGLPGGVFTVRVEVRTGAFAYLEVEDRGGPWIEREPDEERGRGLALVAALAGDGKWAIQAGGAPGTRVVRLQLDWDGSPAGRPAVLPPAQLENARRKDDGMIAATCACGFTELDDEEITDHLHLVFEPDDIKGNDGQAHEERDHLTCACGYTAITSEELDAHFLKVFTPDDATGRDGRRHQPAEDDHGA